MSIPLSAAESLRLRLRVGTRVDCLVQDGFQAGRIVAHFYTQSSFPPGMCCPYQVALDSGRFIFAPQDTDAIIRRRMATDDENNSDDDSDEDGDSSDEDGEDCAVRPGFFATFPAPRQEPPSPVRPSERITARKRGADFMDPNLFPNSWMIIQNRFVKMGSVHPTCFKW